MPAPTVEMSLGGRFLAHVAALTPRYEWRMVPKADDQDAVQPFEPSNGISFDVFGNGGITPVFQGSTLPEGGYAVRLDSFLGAYAYMYAASALSGPGVNPATLAVVCVLDAAPSADAWIFGNTAFGLQYDTDGRVYGYYDGTRVVDAAITTDVDHHIALTRTGASPNDAVALLIDGVSVDTATPSRVSLSFGRPYVARDAADTGTAGFDGTFYHLAIYPETALSAGQCLTQYQSLAWVDVTSDTLGPAALVLERGIRDDKPSSRVAATGTLSFFMNNLASNSGGVTGYYSPGHASCRSGFGKGTAVRVKSGSDVIWTGRIRSIAPSPGKSGAGTKVFATDYLDIAATSLMENVTVLEDVRGDQVFAAVVGAIPAQPNGLTLSAGNETYTLALDNTRDEAVSAFAEFHRLAMSELGYIYQTRTGALVYENRSTRIAGASSASITLASTMHGIDVAEVASSSLNRVQVTTHPRVYDSAATTVLFALVNPLEIGAGETKTIIGPFRAATATGITTRVGGLSMVTPAATTDYTLNTASDGSGTDLTASMTVTADYGPNGVRLTIENTSVDAAYITKMQCRGKGVYDFRTVVLRSQDDAAVADDGVNALNIDMPYQEDPNVGQALADVLLNGYRDLSGTRVRRVSFYPDAAGMPAGLYTADVSTRVAVSETTTGATGEYYINGVKHEYQNGTLPRITWWLAPAEPVSYWVLGTSTLDETTMLGAA